MYGYVYLPTKLGHKYGVFLYVNISEPWIIWVRTCKDIYWDSNINIFLVHSELIGCQMNIDQLMHGIMGSAHVMDSDGYTVEEVGG